MWWKYKRLVVFSTLQKTEVPIISLWTTADLGVSCKGLVCIKLTSSIHQYILCWKARMVKSALLSGVTRWNKYCCFLSLFFVITRHNLSKQHEGVADEGLRCQRTSKWTFVDLGGKKSDLSACHALFSSAVIQHCHRCLLKAECWAAVGQTWMFMEKSWCLYYKL